MRQSFAARCVRYYARAAQPVVMNACIGEGRQVTQVTGWNTLSMVYKRRLIRDN